MCRQTGVGCLDPELNGPGRCNYRVLLRFLNIMFPGFLPKSAHF
jgi:hypothetical protein